MAEYELQSFEFAPGLHTDESDSVTGNRYQSGSMVRFHRGKPQVYGGWTEREASAFTNPVRGAHAWRTADGDRALAWGTSSELDAYFDGTVYDILPEKVRLTTEDPFRTTLSSAVVTVIHLDHGLITGDTVSITAGTNTFDGVTVADGDYSVTVTTVDEYTITGTGTGSNGYLDDGLEHGDLVTITADLDTGLVDGTSSAAPRFWSLDGFGSTLLANPSDGAIYQYVAIASPTPSEILINPSFGSTVGWETADNWAIAVGQAEVDGTSDLNSEMYQIIEGDVEGGAPHTFTCTKSGDDQTPVQIAIQDTSGTRTNIGFPISLDGSYQFDFVMPYSASRLVFIADGSAGETANAVFTVCSLKQNVDAVRVQSAPQYSRGMFVDPNRMVVVYNTIQINGIFNSMAVRWSDQEDATTWISDTDNLAGEYILGHGSEVIIGVASRGVNIISTDSAIYTMRFTGNSANVFSFQMIATGCGCIGGQAMIEHKGLVYWLARDGQFYMYNGGQVQIIDCPIREDMTDNITANQNDKIFACVDSEFNEIKWFYPDSRDSGGANDECSRFVAFNFAENTWHAGELARSTWLPAGVWEKPLAFDLSGSIFDHEDGQTADGSDITWNLKTGKFNVADGQELVFVDRYIPDFERQSGDISVTFTFYDLPRASSMNADTQTITDTTDELLMRESGRECEIEWTNGSGFREARWGLDRMAIRRTGAKR